MALSHPHNNLINIRRGIGFLLISLAVLCLLTWAAMIFGLDIRVAKFFYSTEIGWMYKDIQPFKALYHYGTLPGLALTLAALVLFFMGFIRSEWQVYQKPMLVILLTSIIGAGVLINGIIKPYCGRPRPREITVFNGQWNFCSPCFNNAPGKGLSFPCGHCTMGYLFITLIYLRRKSKALAYGGGAFGLLYGSLLGAARAAQGAHFVTDTLWSLGILLMVSLLAHFILIPMLERSWLKARVLTPKQIWITGIGTACIMGIITMFFLTRRPYYEMSSSPLTLPLSFKTLTIHSNVTLAKHTIVYNDSPPRIALISQGFGWPNAEETVQITPDGDGPTINLEIRASRQGYFAELRHQLLLNLPAADKGHIDVKIHDGGTP